MADEKPDHHFIGPFDVPMKVHWTFWMLAALLTVSIVSIVETGIPDMSSTTAFLWSFATTVAILGTLVCHEYGHVLAARHYGIDTNRILLFLIGGAAEIKGESKSPKQEFVIGGAGPVVSFVAALLFFLAALILPTSEGGELLFSSGLAAFLVVTAGLNVIIAVFNLIPAFPLDGGRLFYAVTWKLLGFKRGVQVAYSVSGVLCSSLLLAGILMMFGAEIPYFGTGIVSGLWIMMIACLLLGNIGLQYAMYVGRDFCPPSRENDEATKSALKRAAEKWSKT